MAENGEKTMIRRQTRKACNFIRLIISGLSCIYLYSYIKLVHLGTSNSNNEQKAQFSLPSTSTSTNARNGAVLPRVLAIVFPQFHSDPLNDKLWGKGFTDWDNLRAAPKKNRLGYFIPRPTELGYYDLTDTFVRKRHGELAREYGIDGLVFHHYWFYDPTHPGPTLQAPLLNMLKDGHPNIPFCLHWCAAKWMDTWLGKAVNSSKGTGDKELQHQFFPNETDPLINDHYNWLREFFHHPNYIKVDGQPVFMVYQKKPSSFPVLRQLRQLAIQDGFPGLYFTLGMSYSHQQLFPKGKELGQKRNRIPWDVFNKTVAYPNPLEWMSKQVLEIPEWCTTEPIQAPNRVPEIAGILTSFDNTPRRDAENANLWSADQPHKVVERFYKSLYASIYYETCCFPHERADKEHTKDDDDRFILINSMNEWAEGMALEPSDVFGRQFLMAVQKAKADVLASGCSLSA
jgi:hypothetical protein